MPTPPAAPKYLGCMLQRLAGKSKVVHGQSVIHSEFFVSLFLAASRSILLRQQPNVFSMAPCIVYHKASPHCIPKSIPRFRPCSVSLRTSHSTRPVRPRVFDFIDPVQDSSVVRTNARLHVLDLVVSHETAQSFVPAPCIVYHEASPTGIPEFIPRTRPEVWSHFTLRTPRAQFDPKPVIDKHTGQSLPRLRSRSLRNAFNGGRVTGVSLPVWPISDTTTRATTGLWIKRAEAPPPPLG